MNRAKMIAYAESFLSYVFSDEELWKEPRIKNIILFGSIARGDFTEKSDIDIFFEVYNKNKIDIVKKRINYLLNLFIKTDIYKTWNLRGIKNQFNPFIGVLENNDLQKSIINDGIVLFGEYMKDIKYKHFILISFESIKEKNKKYRIDRYLFGRDEQNRKQEGIIQKMGGIKINTRAFILPSINSIDIVKKLKQEKVNFRIYDILSDSF